MKSVPAALLHCRSTPSASDAVDVLLQGGLGQAVLGDAEAQHAAGLRLALEHGDGVAEEREVAGGGETAGARAHHRDLLLERDLRLLGQRHVVERVVADEPLEAGDGQRLVDLTARAVGLALVRADAAADGGEGVGLAGDGVRLGVAAVGDEGQVALRAGVHGARALAGAVALLGHRVGVGDGLRVQLVDGLAVAEAPRCRRRAPRRGTWARTRRSSCRGPDRRTGRGGRSWRRTCRARPRGR